jgi:hypothetical protein
MRPDFPDLLRVEKGAIYLLSKHRSPAQIDAFNFAVAFALEHAVMLGRTSLSAAPRKEQDAQTESALRVSSAFDSAAAREKNHCSISL